MKASTEQGFASGELEPFLYDAIGSETPILYHKSERSFWRWGLDELIDRSQGVVPVFVGFFWTDLILRSPLSFCWERE